MPHNRGRGKPARREAGGRPTAHRVARTPPRRLQQPTKQPNQPQPERARSAPGRFFAALPRGSRRGQ